MLGVRNDLGTESFALLPEGPAHFFEGRAVFQSEMCGRGFEGEGSSIGRGCSLGACALPAAVHHHHHSPDRSCMKRLRIIDAEFSPKAGLAIHPGVPDEPKYALIHKGWTAQPKCYSRFVCKLSPLLHRCNTIICSCFFYCLSLPFILFLVLSLFFRQGFTFNCFSMCVADTFVVAALLGLHQICVPKELHRDHPAFLSA